ncbi:MAG TPA: hypothetical protein GX707_02280 [Epulopiscium sp.]|nr:hypothetical protein [Candidatus Epulonipiscium sp.]
MANNRYNANTVYNYGSAAPDIYTEVPIPKAPKTPREKKSRVERKEERRQIFRKRLSCIVSVTAIFIACTAFVWGCAVVEYKQYELKQAKSEIRELKSQVNTTKALIASSTNLDNIKARAINELKMTEPLTHQIIFLDIAKTSYTVIE